MCKQKNFKNFEYQSKSGEQNHGILFCDDFLVVFMAATVYICSAAPSRVIYGNKPLKPWTPHHCLVAEHLYSV